MDDVHLFQWVLKQHLFWLRNGSAIPKLNSKVRQNSGRFFFLVGGEERRRVFFNTNGWFFVWFSFFFIGGGASMTDFLMIRGSCSLWTSIAILRCCLFRSKKGFMCVCW